MPRSTRLARAKAHLARITRVLHSLHSLLHLQPHRLNQPKVLKATPLSQPPLPKRRDCRLQATAAAVGAALAALPAPVWSLPVRGVVEEIWKERMEVVMVSNGLRRVENLQKSLDSSDFPLIYLILLKFLVKITTQAATKPPWSRARL